MAVLRWGQGGTAPPNLAQAPQFLDIVVLLLDELIGSIVISLKFRLAVVASQMMRGQPPPQIFFLEPPLIALLCANRHSDVIKDRIGPLRSANVNELTVRGAFKKL